MQYQNATKELFCTVQPQKSSLIMNWYSLNIEDKSLDVYRRQLENSVYLNGTFDPQILDWFME